MEQINVLGRDTQGVSVEHIMLFQIETLVTIYDKKVFQCILNKDYESCERYLTEFCLKLLDLSDQEQLFVARIFFTGFVTEVIRVKKRKSNLHPKTLSRSYALIAQIEQWENLSEYILSIPEYIHCLINRIIGEQAMFKRSLYLEQAIKIINDNLTKRELTVGWEQVN